MIPYFIFKGIDSKDYMIVNKLPSIIKAEADIDKIEVEGRNGFLTIDKGTHKGYVKQIECTIRNLDNVDFICSWLEGSGDIIFSNELDKIYKATIINQIEFKKVAVTFHRFIINFEVQPHKYLISNDLITLTSPGAIYNPGSANSKPLIKVYGTGSITLNINSNIINLTNVSGYVTIDSELVDAYKDTLLKNTDTNGEFPVFKVGNNTISWTGAVSKLEIIPNWRWI